MSDTYRLTVVKRIPNTNYAEQVEEQRQRWAKDRNRRNNYGIEDMDMFVPNVTPVIDERTLEVELTAEEYDAIKQAVIETFK